MATKCLLDGVESSSNIVKRVSVAFFTSATSCFIILPQTVEFDEADPTHLLCFLHSPPPKSIFDGFFWSDWSFCRANGFEPPNTIALFPIQAKHTMTIARRI